MSYSCKLEDLPSSEAIARAALEALPENYQDEPAASDVPDAPPLPAPVRRKVAKPKAKPPPASASVPKRQRCSKQREDVAVASPRAAPASEGLGPWVAHVTCADC